MESARRCSSTDLNFGVLTTATHSYAIPVANLRLLDGETNLQGITLELHSTECLDSLELTSVVRLISIFVVNRFVDYQNYLRRNMSRSTHILHIECTATEGFMQKYYQDTPLSNLG